MNNVQQQRQNMATVKNRIQQLLQLNEETYAQMHWHSATDWLMHHFANSMEIVDEVMQCEVFWKWWSLHVYHRDHMWLSSIHTQEQQRLLQDYKYYHSVERLTDMNIKDANILFNSYANIKWI